MEVVDLDYEDTNSCSQDGVDFNNDSSQDCTEYSATEIEVGANCVCNDENHETTIDNSLQDEIPGMEPEIHNISENNNNQGNEEAQDNRDNEIDEIPHTQVLTSTPTTVPSPISSSSKLKECKIVLERLPIEYVPSDDDSQDELLDQNKRKSRSIRPRSMSCIEINFDTIQSSISDLTELVS